MFAVSTGRVCQELAEHLLRRQWKNKQEYNMSRVNSPEHKALAREAAAKAVVLLENRKRVLPLNPASYAGKTVLITGPNSGNESTSFCFGDSPSPPSCHGAGMPINMLGTYYSPTPSYISQPIDAARSAFPGAKILHVRGCDHVWCRSKDLVSVKRAAAKADVVLFFGGVSGHWAGGPGVQGAQPNWDPGANSSAEAGHPFDIGIATEGVDRWNISMVRGQEEVLQAAAGASRGPVVVSLIGGTSHCQGAQLRPR